MLIWNITTQTALLDNDDFAVFMPVFAEAQGNNFMVFVAFDSDERYKEVLHALNTAIREQHKIAFGHIVDDATNCTTPIYEILQSFWNDAARACEFEAQLFSRGSCELRRHDGSVTVSNVLTLFDIHRTTVLINARVGHLDVANIIEEWHRQEDGWRGVVTIEMSDEQAARQLVTDAKQLRAGCVVRIDYRSGLYEVSSVAQERNRIDITLHLKKEHCVVGKVSCTMECIKLTDSKTGEVAFQADTLDYRVKNIWAYFEQRKVPRSSLLRWEGQVIIKYAQEQATKDAFNSLQTLLLTNRQFTLPTQEGVFIIGALHYKPETHEVRISLEEVLC